MNGYLLDTDMISAHLRGTGGVPDQLSSSIGRLHASVIALAELTAWLDRRNTPRLLRQGLTDLMPDLIWHPISLEIAQRAGQLRAESFDRGHPLPFVDLLIAATALEHDFTVVTHNLRHFGEVPGLVVEDWFDT